MREIKFDIILWDGKDPETIEHFNIEEAITEDFIDGDYPLSFRRSVV